MKKFVVLLVAFLLVLPLAACDQKPSDTGDTGGSPANTSGDEKAVEKVAYQYYQEALAKQDAATSMVMDIAYDVKLELNGQNMGTSMNGSMEMLTGVTPENSQIHMLANMAIPTLGDVDSEIWFKDGWMYMDMMGMKLKQSASAEDVFQQQGAGKSITFGEDAIVNQEITDTADGGKKLTFLLDGAKMTEYTETLLKSMKEAGGEDVAVDLSTVNVTETLDAEGNVTGIIMDFSATMVVADQEVSSTYYMDMSNIKLNTLTSIEFPSDLEEYADTGSLGASTDTSNLDI
ncbi:MAG: hypothetical protein LBL27_01660 [Coriobacteriales bacterium]|nr:hypothetical protein [Coriobacteriales bacterium]